MKRAHHLFEVNHKGHMTMAGVDVTDLAKEYGTPLYIYDIGKVRENCRAFTRAFSSFDLAYKVSYASKAFSSLAILQVIEEEGLGLDVVSEGELYTAIQAGFPAEKIQFHGNNKSIEELEMALDYGVGTIIIDNFHEIDLLSQLTEAKNQEIDVLIRLTPGIESETHRYIMTGNEDSKFGFNVPNGQADQAFRRLVNHPRLHLLGVHTHIGSQIFNPKGYQLATKILFQLIRDWYEAEAYLPKVINVGGGFGIRYTEADEPLSKEEYVAAIVQQVKLESDQLGIPMPEIWIEPGRSIVGDAGISLYEVGSMKEIEGIRKYIAVNGSMADNIRPALYDAKYDALVANKMNQALTETVSVAGKACESGDMFIWDVSVPELEAGDLLALLSTGAYGYSMASNYNRLRRPAVVFVENGHSQLVVKRETLEDLTKNDLTYKR